MIGFIKWLLFIIGIILLTMLTQIGGVVLLVALPLFFLIDSKVSSRIKRVLFKTLGFITLYLLITFSIIPPLAKATSGRVALPVFENEAGTLKPRSIF